MTGDEKREINQLLIVACEYFDMAKKSKKEVSPIILSKKTKDYSDQEKIDKETIMTSAHLASSAIRLCTIDEKLDDKYQKNKKRGNLTLRKELYDITKSKLRDKNMEVDKITEDIDKVLHFILRNNVAHIEADKKEDKQIVAHLILQEILLDCSLNDMYTKINMIKKDIEEDLKSLSII